MATGPGVDQGKGKFIREFFASNHDANEQSINEAWTADGHDGQISTSLISKIKADLGLTRRNKASAKPAEPAVAKRRGRPRKDALVLNGDHAARPARPAAAASHDEDDTLDELEDSIDELIAKLRHLGGRQDAIKALRRARRMLGHGSDE